MHLKLFFSHIIIFLISIFGFTSLYEYVGNGILEIIYSIFHLIVILFLYLLSGFLSTEKPGKYEFKNYFIIAIVGFLIWLFAVLNSPTDLDWKKGNGGILWLLYRLYISGIETPFNFNEHFSIWTKNVKWNIGILLLLSIIPSLIQAYGGFLKIKWNKKNVVQHRL